VPLNKDLIENLIANQNLKDERGIVTNVNDPFDYLKKEVASTRNRRRLLGSFIETMKTNNTPTTANQTTSLLGSKAPTGGRASSSVGGSRNELMKLLSDVGFKGQSLNTAYAVMMAESGGKATAHNPNTRTGDNSYGLFQINMLGAMGPERLRQYGLNSNNDLFDARKNAEVAFKMSKGGANWTPWSTYKRGDYKRYL
jgi:hypothetical protein